jgi:hypothetical protein
MFVFEGFTRLNSLYDRIFHELVIAFRREFIFGHTPFRKSADVYQAARDLGCNEIWALLEDGMQLKVLTQMGTLVGLEKSIATIWEFPNFQRSNGLMNVQTGLLEVGESVRPPFFTDSPASSILFPFEGCVVFVENTQSVLELLEHGIQSDEISVLELIESWHDKSDLKREADLAALLGLPNEAASIDPETIYVDGEEESPDVPDGETLDFLATNVTVPQLRPVGSSKEFIADAVHTGFPKGKQKNKWADIEERVGYSRRSIVRALKDLGRYDDWARGGQS